MGTHWNCLEPILMTTHNIGYGRELRGEVGENTCSSAAEILLVIEIGKNV